MICIVNHYLMIQVTITPEVTSRGVNRAVMAQLVTLYQESHLGKRLPAYDGRKSLYTAGALPFVQKEFKITLIDDEEGAGGSRYIRCSFIELFVRFLVILKFVFWFFIGTGEKGNSKL